MGSLNMVNRLKDFFYSDFVTTKQIYIECVLDCLELDSVVLEFGAGRGRNDFVSRDRVRMKVGVDVDPVVLENSGLHEAYVLEGGKLPFSVDTFDLIYSTYVFEHLEHPKQAFTEMCRVLKPGGQLVFVTPQKYGYVALLARITPIWFHKKYFALKSKYSRSVREEKDVFEVFYRANTMRDIRVFSELVGLEILSVVKRESIPNYFTFSAFLFLPAIVLERILNRFELFSFFRNGLVVHLKKKY